MFYSPNIPRCQYIKVNGTQCGSPAMRRNRFCFFHKRWHEQRIVLNSANATTRKRQSKPALDLPVLEDANSVQVALMQIMRLLLSGQIEHKTASLLLYGLQTASSNLRQVTFDPSFKEKIVIDPSTVDQTLLGDYPWSNDDWLSEEDESEEEPAAAPDQSSGTVDIKAVAETELISYNTVPVQYVADNSNDFEVQRMKSRTMMSRTMTRQKMTRQALSGASFFCLLLLLCTQVVAQGVATPGDTCKPASMRTQQIGCWILAENPVGQLTTSQVFWHLDQYPTRAAAEADKGPRGTVVESFGKVWLMTIADEKWRPAHGTRVAEIGPLPVVAGEKYTAHFMESDFTPGMTAHPHKHPGPEAFYAVGGQTCLETSDGRKQVGRVGGAPVIVPMGVAMDLTAIGKEERRSIVLVLHQSSQPWVTMVHDWTPKGLCKSSE